MNYKTDSTYEPLYPQTTCDMVIDLFNTDTKSLMGLPSTATGDDAFRELFLAITLDGRALINFTVMGDDGTPCKGVQIKSSAFCDSNGNLTPTVETNDEGKVSVFCNALSVTCSISNYANLSDWSDTYIVVFGEVYDKEITLTRYNFRLFESSGNYKFSPEIVRVDVSCCGGGGAGGPVTGRYFEDYDRYDRYAGAGGGGGYASVLESVSFIQNQEYSLIVGQGGVTNSNSGGSSSFLSVLAQGGGNAVNNNPGTGNGNGGQGAENTDTNGSPGTAGTGYVYSSMIETQLVGGGGGGGGNSHFNDNYEQSATRRRGGAGGSPCGGKGGDAYANSVHSPVAQNGSSGKKYGGGGGSGAISATSGSDNTAKAGVSGNGAQGCVAIRMYTQSTLPA